MAEKSKLTNLHKTQALARMAYRMQQLLGVKVLIHHMCLPRFNLFTADFRGIPCGFEAVADLETARSRLGQLASANPGEYFVFDLTAKHVLVGLVSTNEEIHAIRE